MKILGAPEGNRNILHIQVPMDKDDITDLLQINTITVSLIRISTKHVIYFTRVISRISIQVTKSFYNSGLKSDVSGLLVNETKTIKFKTLIII